MGNNKIRKDLKSFRKIVLIITYYYKLGGFFERKIFKEESPKKR
jgi:hypothetical protein